MRWWLIKIAVNNKSKAIQIWCTQDERDSDGFWDRLKKATAGSVTYKKVIYVSGDQSLAMLTADILKHNR